VSIRRLQTLLACSLLASGFRVTYDELREGDSPMGVDRVGRHLVVLDVLGIANVPAQFEACHTPYAITGEVCVSA